MSVAVDGVVLADHRHSFLRATRGQGGGAAPPPHPASSSQQVRTPRCGKRGVAVQHCLACIRAQCSRVSPNPAPDP